MKNKFIMILKIFLILTIVSITLGREILISDNIHKGKAMEIKSTSIGDSGPEGVLTRLEGEGTESSPYLLTLPADLEYMRNAVNSGDKINGEEGSPAISAHYRLEQDINVGNWDEPICPFGGELLFEGVLDGNNKKITYTSNNQGLFGQTGSDAIIKNLNVCGTINESSNAIGIGLLVGLNKGTIEKCNVEGYSTGAGELGGIIFQNRTHKYSDIGGIVGDNYGTIKDCYLKNFKMDISFGTGSEFSNVGLVVGINRGRIEGCRSVEGNKIEERLNGDRSGDYLGGFVGANGGTIVNSYTKININVNYSSVCEALFAGCNQGTIENVFCRGDIKNNNVNYLGGLVGNLSSPGRDLGIGIIDNGYHQGKRINRVYNRYESRNQLVGEAYWNFKATNLFYFPSESINPSEYTNDTNLINIYPQEQYTQTHKNIRTEDSKQNLLSSLNANLKDYDDYHYFPWIIEEDVNDGYPIMMGRPYYMKENNTTISVYGNGYPIIVDKDKNGKTVIYFAKDGDNEIYSEDSLVKTLDANGLEKEGEEARFGSECTINIYGGIHNSDINRSSKIIVKGGKINKIFGGGKLDGEGKNAKVSGTTIDIQGGEIGYIDANGEVDNKANSSNVETSGKKTINISGNPTIGTGDAYGVNLDSFDDDSKLIISGKLTGNKGSIRLIKDDPQHWDAIATATDASFTERYDVFKVKDLPDNNTIFNKENDIIIVETFNAFLNSSDRPESNSNVVYRKNFGYNAAKRDFKWTGKISANPGYVLPNKISVKMKDRFLTDGTDYTWNKMTGEISIGKVDGNIEVTANAIYVPPIIAVDKPFVSTTDFSYTGTPQSPILIDTDKYTVSVTRETKVGEYTMVVSLKDKVYTRWNDGTNDDLYIKWRINKVDLKVIAKDKSITYGDSPTNAGVSYEGFVNGENQSVLKGDLSYDYNYARYDNVGNYVITPKGYEADNYNITYTSGTLKVFPKKLSFKWSSPSEFKYDGKVKVMTASIVGIVNNDDVRIASYAHNKTDKVGTYVAKVTGITGTKKDNYTLEGATNISKKWSIVKDKDKEEDKDKNENKDNIKDNGDKNDTSGSNNNDKGNVNNNKNNNNNSSNNTSSNKGNNNNNQSNGNYDNINMYDKLATNNDYKTDIDGAIEGVKISDNEIQVELNNGMIISAMGDFEESIRLMVKEIKNKRKEWRWVNSLTKDIGTNKGLYDIFFVNSKGVKVNTGKGTKISILSREKLQKADVYYIRTSSERLKLKSWKEEYTVKFRMIENGYYTLILNDKNNLIEGKDDDVNVVDKYSTTDNNDKNANKDADTINDKDNQGGIEEDKTNENASKDGDGGSEINTSQDSTNHNIQNIGKQQKEKEDGINWLIIISIILVIIVTIIVSVFILKRFSKDRYEVE